MESDYDAIVTGAGIAGMMAGLFLARAGRRVLVLEANHQPGGLMAGIRRQGFSFDVGDQSFENLGIVFPLLERLGLHDPADWHRSRYQIRMPDVDVVVESLEQVERELVRAFPGDAAGLARVFRVHRGTSELVTRLVRERAVPFVGDDTARAALALARIVGPRLPRLVGQLRQDFGDFYREQMAPGGLRDLLSRCGYSRMCTFVASAFWHLWAEDYWYPRGGLGAFFDRLATALRRFGGELACKRRVARYLVENGEVRGVETARGERFTARSVIHTGSLHDLVFSLLEPERFPARFVRRLRDAPLSDAMVSVYLGVAMPADEVRRTLRASHLFYFPSYECARPRPLDDPDWHRSQFLEITAHSLSQPELAPPGKTSLVVQAFSDARWSGHWGLDGPPEGRKARYRELKTRVARQLVERAEEVLPGLARRIEWQDVGAPASAVRFTGNPEGATCGFALHPRGLPGWPLHGSLRSPVRALYVAGHYALWPGSVPVAALSGKLAADLVLRGEGRSWRPGAALARWLR